MVGSTWLRTLTVCLLLTACGDDDPADGQTGLDASVKDAAVDARGALLDAELVEPPLADAGTPPDAFIASFALPPSTWSDCADKPSDFGFRTLFDVSELDGGAQLLKASGNLILARGPVVGTAVIELGRPGDAPPPKVSVHTFLAYGEGPIGLVTGTRDFPRGVVLTCYLESCPLLALTADDELEPVANGGLVIPQYQLRDLRSDGVRPCALGRALYCFDNGWRTVVPILAADDEFVSLSADDSGALAISKTGRVWRGARMPGSDEVRFTEIEKIVAPPRQLSVSGPHAYLLTPDALWCWTQQRRERCDGSRKYQAALMAFDAESQALVSEQGEVLTRSFGPWCREPGVKIDGPILSATSAPCGASANFRFLTAQKLIGQDSCILVP